MSVALKAIKLDSNKQITHNPD